ncbi:MAG: hypothetical protein KDH99_09150 [Alcanivoracaceae bacterium]|nr:hypothetical protein [Alcanivoracaceae bacterium]
MRKRLHGWISALTLSVFYLPAMAQNSEKCARLDVQPKPAESAYIEDAIAVLSSAYDTGDARRNALFTQLKAAPKTPSAAEQALVDKMYILLAASWLSEQQTDKAREVLRVIGVNSPSAVTAALLLAESWRMDEQPDKALQWFLRIAAQHPQDVDALQGLLAAAHSLADDGQPELALALYARIEQQASDAVLLLNDYITSYPDSIAAVLDSTNPLPTSLRNQASQRLYRSTRDTLFTADRANRRSQQIRTCLTAMIADYQRRIAAAEQGLANVDATLAAMEQAHQQRQAQITSLQTQIRSGDNSDEQLKRRRAVRALMNQDAREQAQQQALLQNRDRLPALVAHTRKRLSALLAYYQNIERNSGEVVSDTLRETLQKLANNFSDVAGEAALGKAQLQEEFAD